MAFSAQIAGAQALLTPDSGRFVIRIHDTDYATDSFTADAEGGSESAILFKQPDRGTLRISVRAAGGRLSAIESVENSRRRSLLTLSRGAKLGVGDVKQRDLAMKEVVLPRRVFPYSALAPEQMRLVLAAYDLRLGGPQLFNVVYSQGPGPAGPMLGRLVLAPAGSKAVYVGGKTVAVVRYHVSVTAPVGTVEAELAADPDGRILLFRVPTQKLVAVRDGYQELDGPEPPADPALSQPAHQVRVERNVRVPMRDGDTLATDVYRPDAVGKFPVILERTCTGRQNVLEAAFYARRGYVFIAQDVRGKFESGGEWRPFISEAHDGYDTLEWCGRQRWSNGSVGMCGEGYQAFTQWAAARENSRRLKCIVSVAPLDPLFAMPFAYGQLALSESLRWLQSVEGAGLQPLEPAPSVAPLKTLPLTNADLALYGRHVDIFQEWLRHAPTDAYWEQAALADRLRAISELPALHIAGWFDDAAVGTKHSYAAMVESGHRRQKLILGPWPRALNVGTNLRGLHFGPTSVRDLETITLRWFDRWLKNVPNRIDVEPPVEVFLLGANTWRTYSAWPPRESKPARWYFHASPTAGSEPTYGLLSPAPPTATEPPDRYDYDPKNPFLSAKMLRRGDEFVQSGSRLKLSPPGLGGRGAEPRSIPGLGGGEAEPRALSETEARAPESVTYTSAELTEPLTLAGLITVHLTAESSARDTDWFAALMDIAPDGTALPLAHGIVQARYRRSYSAPDLLKPNEVAAYTVDLATVGCVVKAGHRIRVIVASSCFPLYARSLNTAENNLTSAETAIAHQTIYHTPARPSYIVLPLMNRR